MRPIGTISRRYMWAWLGGDRQIGADLLYRRQRKLLSRPGGKFSSDAASGFLSGKITKDDHLQSDKAHDCRQVQVEIMEAIYGWVGGSSTVSLRVDPSSFAQLKSTTLGEGGNAWPMTAGKSPAPN